MTEICATCKWWVWNRMGPDFRSLADYHERTNPGLKLMSGECRRHAPDRADVTFTSITTMIARQWPITGGMDFCGEYKDRSIV